MATLDILDGWMGLDSGPDLAKAEVEGSNPFFCLVFYLLGLPPCFHKDKVVVAAKQAKGSTKIN